MTGTSGETVVVETESDLNVEGVERGDGEVEMFPDDRADGPLSGVFRAARRFRHRIESED